MPSISGYPSDDSIIPAKFVPGAPNGGNPELRPNHTEERRGPEHDQTVDPYSFRLETQITMLLRNDDNPDNIVQEVRIKVICNEDDQDQEAGRAFVIIVHADRCEAQPLFDVMDATSQRAMEYCEAFYDTQGRFRERVAEQFGDTTSQGLLILDHIDLAPKYRIRDLELLIADQILEVFGYGLGLAACRPFPAQAADEEEAAGVPEAYIEAAQQKLASYWERLGFKRVGRTDYYALNLDMVRRREFW